MKHQLHSSTATGGLPILNFDLRLFWACSQALNTFKKVKLPGLLRPECLHHGLLQPFPDTTGTHQHPSVQSLGLFAFARRTSASFSLLMLPGLSAVSSFWGMLTRCQGPGIASYQLLMGLGTHVFVSIPRSKISCVEEKTQVSWNCKQLNCVAMPNKNHFGFQLAVSWRQPFGRCVRQQVLFQNTDCYFTNPCVMAASAAGRQDGCFKSLLNAKI